MMYISLGKKTNVRYFLTLLSFHCEMYKAIIFYKFVTFDNP